ncbi:hypothetical protein J2X97_003317 [Epilithonimonas hungarica]|uniref:hypothetical protein n=1 Tax=Epilithonimonas hungarica TaxID=454006 RepID=UPI0027856631|nr:hypothetical protein [Epilithonimonas hungarica]MDP9957648.1 hypothetical protein [Epilithonimonas hungarica]
MIKHFNLFLFLTLQLSCQEVKHNEITEQKKQDSINSMINIVLEKQLRNGANQYFNEAGVEIIKKPFEKGELDVTIQIVKSILKSNGYKVLINNEFNKKIQIIFGRIINPNSENKYLYINYFNKCDKEFNYSPNNGIDYLGTYIIKNENFITDFYYVPEIINYQKEFPEIAKVEENTPIKYVDKDNNDYSIELWKDLENNNEPEYNLSDKRKKNIRSIVARNMYLFNDNKAQYKWLILNDQYFMESLVKTFGYTEDSDLLKWIIERTKFDKNNPQDYGKLFWIKQCDGTLKLHANTFKVLQTLYQPNDNSENRFILDNIQAYLEYLGNLEDIKTENISEADKVKIMANLTYFAEQYKYNKNFNSNSKMMGRLRFFLNDEDIEILKKNNYFNLPKFKEWWDKADYDEYIVDYNQVWGRDNEPIDYNEWRNQHPKK